MTSSSSAVSALQKFGYTERQATFLHKVALHSGYFLRRQYDLFAGTDKGGSGQRFLEQAIEKGHAMPLRFCETTVVLHLSARPIYRAVGEENSRNRRCHQPFAVKAKLMTLDFILERRQLDFIGPEQDRIALFTDRLGLPLSVLPAKSYRSKSGATRTVRYFVDRNPIFLSAAKHGAAPSVGFVYVDAGGDTTGGFRSYLAQYRRLFQAVETFHLVYVASHSRLISAATRDFRKAMRPGVESAPEKITETGHLLAHFEARRRHEERNYAGFDTSALKRLSCELKEFSGPRYDALFALYRAQGTARVLSELGEGTTAQVPAGGVFEACVLPFSYGFLGDQWGA